MERFQHTAARRRLGQRLAQGVSVASGFNTQPPEGGWSVSASSPKMPCSFNTQPPEGGWQKLKVIGFQPVKFQHTAARRRLDITYALYMPYQISFNTQPPEGGWVWFFLTVDFFFSFQHTAARRRLVVGATDYLLNLTFQHTAARRRLGLCDWYVNQTGAVSTHSRPKAAGLENFFWLLGEVFQHTAARRRLVVPITLKVDTVRFQHTAARRRLGPKIISADCFLFCFNTQPPEGGWMTIQPKCITSTGFQHTAARRRLGEPSDRNQRV